MNAVTINSEAPVSELFAFGSNGSGQLGLVHRDDVSTPAKCEIEPLNYPTQAVDVKQLAMGGNHTLALLNDGRLFAAGTSPDGRCGAGPEEHLHKQDAKAPSGFRLQRVATRELSGISFCSATWEASIFVSGDRQRVFSSGTGHRGELGLGPHVTVAEVPTEIQFATPLSSPVKHIASGMGHVVLILENGDVYGWGNGKKGQLTETKEEVWSPEKFSNIHFSPERAVCGKDFTCLVDLPRSGQHIVLGSDKRNVRSSAPDNIKGWRSIGASWGSIYVLFEDGSLIGWGRDDHGQLPPHNLPPIQDFAAGSEHVVAKTKAGRLLAWGWGEHGNCGLKIDRAGGVPRDWNEIMIEGEVKLLAAGCATSWLYVQRQDL